MVFASLLRRFARRHAVFVLACAGLLGLFQLLLCAAVGSFDVSGALHSVLDSLPPMLQAFLSTRLFGGMTPHGLLAFGWNHPITHAAGTAVAIVLGTRAIAGEAEAGLMELHLAQPLARGTWLGSYVVFGAFALALVTTAGLAGTALGQRAFGLEPFPARDLLRLGLAYTSLQLAWFGVTLAFSAFGREAGRVSGAAFIVALLSYFAEVIGGLWTRVAFALPWSPHHHYAPQAILAQDGGLRGDIAWLGALALAGLALAAWRFAHRDLP